MFRSKTYFLPLIIAVLFIACSTQNTFDDAYPKSSLGIHIGTVQGMYESIQNSDFTFTEINYNLLGLSEDVGNNQPVLNIDVEHAGGEGGCPTHKFFIQWDNTFELNNDGGQKATLGLAGFLVNSEITCEALVRETLEYDLNNIFGEQLEDVDQINVINLSSSAQDSLIRAQ